MTEKIVKLLSQKKYIILVGIMVLGIIFLAISEYIPTEKTSSDNQFDEAAYIQNLEGRLEELLDRMEGVSQVKVMVTLSSSQGYRYATETYKSLDGGESTGAILQYRQNGSGQTEPILTAVTAPEIKGVSVVCKGAGDDVIRMKVIAVIASALDLSTNRIYVTE